MIEIKNLEGKVLFSGEYKSVKDAVEDAAKKDVSLQEANLSGADLYRASLYRAILSGANLSGANLFKADLYMANLSGANLYRAKLYGADLEGANLSKAILEGANTTLNSPENKDGTVKGKKPRTKNVSTASITSQKEVQLRPIPEPSIAGAEMKEEDTEVKLYDVDGDSKKPSIENPAVVEQAEKPKLTVETSILVSFSSLKRKLRVSEEQLQRARGICLKAQGKKRENEVIELVFDPEGVYIPVFLVGRKNAYVLDFQGRISAIIDKGDELTFAVLTALKVFPIAMSKNKVGTNLTSKHGNEMDFQVGQEMFFDDDVHADI